MKFSAFYTKSALEDLKKTDSVIAKRVVAKIKFYLEQQNPLLYSKKLKPPFDKFGSFRSGDYRALIETRNISGTIEIYILRIKHRKEVYE